MLDIVRHVVSAIRSKTLNARQRRLASDESCSTLLVWEKDQVINHAVKL